MNKWKELQLLQNKINMISDSVIQKENKMKDSFFKALKNYYKHKYRLLFLSHNNLRLLGLNNELPLPKKKIKINQSEMLCCYEQVTNYFFLLRNDKELLSRFIKFLKRSEERQIAQLFVHFFFEDISSETNPSLIELIQLLMKSEIRDNPYHFISSFLQSDSFLSLILLQLIKIKDIRDYYAFAFSDFFSELEKNENPIQLSLNNSIGSDTGSFFKVDFEIIKSKKVAQSMIIDYNRSSTIMPSSSSINDDVKSSFRYFPFVESDNYIFNELLQSNITEKKLRKVSQRPNESEVMKQFYLKCHQRLQNNPGLYSAECLRKLCTDANEKDLERYKHSMDTIISYISKVVQIFSNNNCIPETIRRICVYITEELQRQYRDIDQLSLLSIVGKFFIDVLLIPSLLKPELNGLLFDHTFLSIKIRQTLTVICPILSKLFTFELFDSSNDILYVPFNSTMMSLMPEVIEFLTKLISPNRKNPFNHSMEIGKYQAFCISLSEIIILLDKVKLLFPTEAEIKPFKDLPNVKSILEEQTKSEKVDDHYLFLSEGYSPVVLEKFKIPQIKAKLISYPKESNHSYVNEIKCAISNLFRSMPYTLSDDSISTQELFEIIHQKTLFFTNKNEFEKTSNLPLVWYTSYIQKHLHSIPEEDSKDDYQGLYEKVYNEVKAISDSLANKSILSYELSNDLHFVQKQAALLLEEKREMKKLAMNILVKYLISNITIEICFMNGIDLIDFERKNHFQIPKDYEPNSIYLIILNNNRCIHQLFNEAASMSLDYKSTVKQSQQCHFNTLYGFISKFKQCAFFADKETSSLTSPNANSAKDILTSYMEQMSKVLSASPLISHRDEPDKEEEQIKKLLDLIQEHILKYSWNERSLSDELKKSDSDFINFCTQYQWINPVEHLKIPNECLSKVNFELASSFLKKLDIARTPNEIISLFQKTTDILNKSLAFTSGKTEVGADDLNPIFIYIVIQCRPKRMVSQFNYCKMFLGESNLLGKTGYIVTTLELIIQCISNLNHETLSVSIEEFEAKCAQSRGTAK